jgi:hypothetical protein
MWCGKKRGPKAAFDSDSDKLSPKSCAYDALFSVNQHVEQALWNLERLRQLGLFETRFRRESLRACQATIEETRSWINFETTECLHDREQRDWARFGKVRRRWEEKYEDPKDALIWAKKLMRKSARKERRK